MNRRERRARKHLLEKTLKKNPAKKAELDALAMAMMGEDVKSIMENEQEELKEMRESKELKGTISNFMDALTVTDDNPDPSITIECIDKGTIVLSLDRSAKDERCTNPECITCRGYDAVEGVVDRHLLSEKQKAERDAQALEEQKLRDPEGYKAFLKEKAQDDLAEDVDFEEI